MINFSRAFGVAIMLFSTNSFGQYMYGNPSTATCAQQRQSCVENNTAQKTEFQKNNCTINSTMHVPGGPLTYIDQPSFDACMDIQSKLIAYEVAAECRMEGCVDPVTGNNDLPEVGDPAVVNNEVAISPQGAPVVPKPKAKPTDPVAKTDPAGKPAGSDPAKTDDGKTPPEDQTQADNKEQDPNQQQNQTNPSSTAPGGDPSYDLQQAQQAQQEAQKCCNNPSSCSGQLSSSGAGGMSSLSSLASQMSQQQATGAMGQGGGGLQQACQMMGQLGGGGQAANASYAGICYAKMSNCTAMVRQFQSKYSSMPEVQSQLSSIGSSCQSLNSKYAALSQQSTAGASSGSMGNLCNQMAAAQAQPAGLGAPAAPTCEQDPTNPACVNCNTHPENPNCVKASQDTQTAGFQPKADDSDLSGFNTPNLPTNGDPNIAQPAGGAYESMAANIVANNTGGGVPGGNGSPNAGGGGGRGGYGGSAGYNTDVLHNAQLTGTGGFSGYGGGNTGNIEASGGGGFTGYKSASTGGDGGFMGIDLKKYLPGHEKDPNRKPAGLGAYSAEIGPKYGDIFKRISDRMQTVCRFNRLLDCETK